MKHLLLGKATSNYHLPDLASMAWVALMHCHSIIPASILGRRGLSSS